MKAPDMLEARSAVHSFVILTLIVMGHLSGCLTVQVIDKAFDRYPDQAKIKSVRSAVLQDHDLFLQLEVQDRRQREARTIVSKVSIDEIGSFQNASQSPALKEKGLAF